MNISKSRLKEIIREEIHALNEGRAFTAWRSHEMAIQKLYRDTIWAQKNVPNKKKEVKMIQKLLKQLDPLVRVITGQVVDKK